MYVLSVALALTPQPLSQSWERGGWFSYPKIGGRARDGGFPER